MTEHDNTYAITLSIVFLILFSSVFLIQYGLMIIIDIASIKYFFPNYRPPRQSVN